MKFNIETDGENSINIVRNFDDGINNKDMLVNFIAEIELTKLILLKLLHSCKESYENVEGVELEEEK